jgi:hypothetical protein
VIYGHREPWWNDTDRGNLFVHQNSLVILPAESCSSKAGGTGEGNDQFGLRNIFVHTSKCLTSKILRHGADDFTSPPMEGELRNCIALKNQPSWLGFNLRSLGPVAITLTTRPPRLTTVTLLGCERRKNVVLTCEICVMTQSIALS